ncbi:kinase-like domain-containing protein [Armillaria fumosa]|nr:kinase-like domain-containing protein [Armillaria fumosa]
MASSATAPVIPKAEPGVTVLAPAWVLKEEDRKRYIPGGYHPTHVGDNYAGKRYTITGKLGWGEYSTVWLARDNEASIDVALKIMTDEATQTPQLCELEFVKHLRRQNPSHVGYPHVVYLTDSFYIDGPHGRHLCVNTVQKRIMRDVLYALDYVHSDCNIIHTDVKITNVVVTAPLEEMPEEGVGALIPAQLYTFPASSDNDTPVTITKSIQIVPDLNDPEAWFPYSFKLIDFGVDKTDQHFTQEVCPVGIRPPEVALRAGWGKPLYGMLVGKPLFPVRCDPLFLPAYQLQALGEFPASLRNRSRISKAWFNDDDVSNLPYRVQPCSYTCTGSLRHKDVFPKKSLEVLMEEQIGGTLTLSPDCLHFMHKMLTLEPDERASIEELLRHPWLN